MASHSDMSATLASNPNTTINQPPNNSFAPYVNGQHRPTFTSLNTMAQSYRTNSNEETSRGSESSPVVNQSSVGNGPTQTSQDSLSSRTQYEFHAKPLAFAGDLKEEQFRVDTNSFSSQFTTLPPQRPPSDTTSTHTQDNISRGNIESWHTSSTNSNNNNIAPTITRHSTFPPGGNQQNVGEAQRHNPFVSDNTNRIFDQQQQQEVTQQQPPPQGQLYYTLGSSTPSQQHQLLHQLPTPTTITANPTSQTPQSIDLDDNTAAAFRNIRHIPQNQVMGSHDSTRHPQWRTEQEASNKTDTSTETHSEGKDRDGEESTDRTSETGADSTGAMTPLHTSEHAETENSTTRSNTMSGVSSPSTVSTAPSTDDASLHSGYKLEEPESMLPHLLQGNVIGSDYTTAHRRSRSWGDDFHLQGSIPHNGGIIHGHVPPAHPSSWATKSPSMRGSAPLYSSRPVAPSPHGVWGGGAQATQRVASFRNEAPGQIDHDGRNPYDFAPTNHKAAAWQHQQQHAHQHQQQQQQHLSPHRQHHQLQRHFQSEQQQQQQQHQVPFASQQPRNMQVEIRNTHLYNAQPNVNVYTQGAPPKRGHNQPHPQNTPVQRTARNARQQGAHQHRQQSNAATGSPHQPSSNPQRSSSEILKTLLRKKACLYEPDTSRSVALVTWLVGRELALEYGFFSRQQLQSGVHACVSDKIDSGTITRTKVNRCMQIILNSCFHYIIPRPDGTEEKGDVFREMFGRSVQDDSFLLRYLPAPWNDLHVDKTTVIQASLNDGEQKVPTGTKSAVSTPKSSPKISGLTGDRSPGKDSHDGDVMESKRAVLLCFNENVRSAEDVFRCHNEFIRDTANASNLQLSAQEWRNFFGKEAARAPYLWGNVGIPMLASDSHGVGTRQSDVLGQMSQDELSKFRTTWCTKRYDHDHDLCGFAHVEVNGGWLRRSPNVYSYQDEICSFISSANDERLGPNSFVINECPNGVRCGKAHSNEEILYHPKRYKMKLCSSSYGRSSGCYMGDVCPRLHPPDSNRPMKKPAEPRSHGARHPRKNNDQPQQQQQQQQAGKSTSDPPFGSPVVYASPAPFSSFEKQLMMPGLQSLFRRQCSVVRAHARSMGKCDCCYSCFGDDWGIGDGSTPLQSPLGLPPVRRP